MHISFRQKNPSKIIKLIASAKKVYIPQYIVDQVKKTAKEYEKKQFIDQIFLKTVDNPNGASKKELKKYNKLVKEMRGKDWKSIGAEFGGPVEVLRTKNGELLFNTKRRDPFFLGRYSGRLVRIYPVSTSLRENKEYQDMQKISFHTHPTNNEISGGDKRIINVFYPKTGGVIVGPKGASFYPSSKFLEILSEEVKEKTFRKDSDSNYYLPLKILSDKDFLKKMRQTREYRKAVKARKKKKGE